MKKKLLSKTTVWKYEDRTVIHTKTNPEEQLFYFSGNDKPFEWDSNGGYIDPKPRFIKWFKNRIKRFFRSVPNSE